MKKYVCEEGSFTCRHCNTVYPYSDLRDACEGKFWFQNRPPDKNLILLDHFNAQVGERVLRTQYHGDDYAKLPEKAGIFLTWEWTTVRARRVVPTMGSPKGEWHRERYSHIAEYKIGELEESRIVDILGDKWEEYASGAVLAMALGPYHFWSQSLVENILDERWPDLVFNQCEGEKTEELLRRKKEEGYAVRI